ncbi:G patch domain and ankyrin repeat-containing protein 1 [Centroberyx gerrardi]|uniref:G patch domain and ankyrin repeat-containing protein 1 n=1 Tax=Centroberyx gerrardi TaxID=166262 RepID=UPI003AAD7CAC
MTALGYFTPASEQDIFCNSTTQKSSPQPSSILSGEEARQFYESLTKDGDGPGEWRSAAGETQDGRVCQSRQKRREANRRARRRISGRGIQQGQTDTTVDRRVSSEGEGIQSRMGTRERSNVVRSMELQGLKLLRCAQEGDLSGLRELISRGVDINFQDSYFWTAVMCASWAGQRASVRLLLQRGAAWVGVVDTQGRDARELALAAGHQGVLEELESYGRNAQQDTEPDSSAPQPQWCDVCGNRYSSSLSSHLSSTLHQFSLRRPPPTPHYCLPPSSASYKMMVRCGWDPEKGLGPEGAGPMQPVPTVLKRDQKGLGYGPMKRAKVTHFTAKDHEAVKPSSKEKEARGGRGKRKEESRRKEEKDKNWERDFRASFYF